MPFARDMTEEEQDALRDRFAMAALAGIMADGGRFNSATTAETAYMHADAMMEARDAQRGEGDG